MGVILILILASLAMALVFLGAFVWSVRTGQFEDTTTPSMRVLLDEPVTKPTIRKTSEPRRSKSGGADFKTRKRNSL